MAEPVSPSDDLRLEAAATWHARMSEDVGESEWDAFTAWLEADPQNRHAFDAVDAASAIVTERLAATPITSGDVIPLPTAWLARAVRQAWKPVAVAAALLLGVFLTQIFAPPKTERLATAVGESRDVTLADGSTVHLNTNTAVEVSFGRGVRGARLEKGEALFEVAPDAKRPFDVEVGDRRVHVVGTAFDVLRYGGRVAVTVKHGIVQVGAGAGSTPVSLHPGDQYQGREGSPAFQLAKTDPNLVAEWQNGRLLFENAPLSQVAADLSRYFVRPVVIHDELVNNLRFTGVLKIDDELVMLQRLAAFVPIIVQAKEDQVVLERGPSK